MTRVQAVQLHSSLGISLPARQPAEWLDPNPPLPWTEIGQRLLLLG